MLDNDTDSWILRTLTSTCSLVFSCLESLKTPKKTLGGCIFIQFSILRLKKYKKYHRRTLLTFVEEKVNLFSYLVREVRKRLNYHLPNAPSRAAYSLSFMSVKESKITQKDPFQYDKWGLQQ